MDSYEYNSVSIYMHVHSQVTQQKERGQSVCSLQQNRRACLAALLKHLSSVQGTVA